MIKQIVYNLKKINKSIDDLWQSHDEAYKYTYLGFVYFFLALIPILLFTVSDIDNFIIRCIFYYFDTLFLYSAIVTLCIYCYVNNKLQIGKTITRIIKTIYVLLLTILTIVWMPAIILLILANSFKIFRVIMKNSNSYFNFGVILVLTTATVLCLFSLDIKLAEIIESFVMRMLAKHNWSEVNSTFMVFIFIILLKIEFDIIFSAICKILECFRVKKISNKKGKICSEVVDKGTNEYKEKSKGEELNEDSIKIENIRKESLFYKKQSWKIQLVILVLLFVLAAFCKQLLSVANGIKDAVTIITLMMLIRDKNKEWSLNCKVNML